MSKSLYSGMNKVYFRSYLLLNIVASSAYMSIFRTNFGAKNYKAVFWVLNFLVPKYQQKSARKMLIKLTPE